MKKYRWRRSSISTCMLVCIAILFLSACVTDDTTKTTTSDMTTTVKFASAVMKHSPSGTVELQWDRTTHIMTVHLAMAGLAAKSVHAVHLNAGSCKNGGQSVYALPAVTADEIGFASVNTELKNVITGIPATGWFVIVDNVTGTKSTAIACANIFNATASTNISQSVQATLVHAYAPNQSASGLAQLVDNNNMLMVILTMKGLVPHSEHVAHLHTGSCASQGDVVYTLKPVVVNAAGEGSSETVIPNIAGVPRSGWYVNVHLGAVMKKPIDMDPIACGDVTPARS
ncbi:MAG TPA: CHRD domain-containing protein [Dictyobacter sp.]|nr:CHRD domain-containing protein [Dictyobacter sp.]